MRQQGTWKLHPYNFGTQNLFLLLSFWQNWINLEPQIATIINELMTNCSYSPPLYPYCHTTPTNSFLPCVSFLTTTKINKWHTNTDSTMIHIFFSSFSLPLFQPACFLTFSLFSFFLFPQHTLFLIFFCFSLLNSTNLPDPPILFLFSFLPTCTCYSFTLKSPKVWKLYLPHQVPMAIWIWCPPKYYQLSTFDPIHNTHIGYLPFSLFSMTYLLAMTLVSTQ